ncbi:MAG: DUF6531 domain-containing protein, partial [Pseudomonadales bacterium]|nr:DUF6531 domain-containing protein [Pseudomonadales bacterium]
MHPTVEVVYLDTVYYLFPPSAQFLQQKGIPGLCVVSDVQEGLTFLDSVTFKFGGEDQLHELLHNHSGTPTSRSALFQTIAEAMVDGRITIIRAGGYDLWLHAQTELNCGQSARVDAFKETKGFAVLSHFQKNPNTLAPDDYNSTLCEGEDLLLDYQEEQLGQGRSVGPLLGGGIGFPFRAAMFNGTLLDKVSYGSLLRQRAIRVDAQQRKAVRRTWDKSGAGNGSTNTQSATSSTSSAASATSSRTDMLANRHTRFVDELKSEQAQSENNQATNASETNSDTEKHTLDLFCERQDAKPASGLPFKVTFLNDGSEQSGTLDSQGSYHMDGLEPGAVAVEFGEAPDDGAIAATRAQITSALAEVIAEEKAEAAEYEAKFANMNPLEKAIVVEAHAEKGFFNAGVGLVTFAYDVVKAAHPLSMLNKAYGAAKAAYTTEDENWIGVFVDNYQQANHEDLINVLGFDPAQISREQMAEAFEIASLIYEDAETQAILKDFASEYAASQHTLEWAEFAGGAAFEIVLGAVLAAATGGAGTAAVAASKARMMKSLAKLQPLFKKLATQLKGKYSFKQKSGQTNSTVSSKLETPNTVEAPSAKAAKDNQKTGDNNETGQNDTGACTPSNDKVCTSGEPISMITGEELLEQTDFTLNGPIPLVWKRTYRSSNDNQRGLGYGWTFPLCETLHHANDQVIFITEEGRYITFNCPAINDNSRNHAERLTLSRTSESRFIVQEDNQILKVFEQTGDQYRLTSLIDNFKNRIDIHYSEHSETNEIVAKGLRSSWGTFIDFEHNAMGLISGLVQRHADSDARKTLVRYVYDANQDLVAIVDAAGHRETFAYTNHVITKRTLKTGFSFHFEWDQYNKFAKCQRQWGDRGIYNYRFEWDEANQISHSIDSNGGRATFHYNDRGQIVKEIDPEGGIKEMRYDDQGQLVEEIDANGFSNHYAYNDQGHVTTVLSASGYTQRIAYNDNGQPTRITDGVGNSWTRAYNEQGMLTAITDPSGHQTRFEYNTRGQVSEINHSSGLTRKLQWNGQCELVSDTWNTEETTRFDHNEFGDITATTDQTGQQTRYHYDLNGNVTRIDQPDGTSVRFQYNENDQLTRFTDAGGRTTQYQYDGLSQVRKRIDPAGQQFEYEYDNERNLTALINEKLERYELTYDRNERLIQEVGFDGRIQQYQYDPAGHLRAHVEGLHLTEASQLANTTRFRRDPSGRLLEKHSPDGESSRFAYNGNGQLIEATNNARKLQYRYNKRGLLAQEIQDDYTLSHRYDALGNRTETQLPDGKVLGFNYDLNGLF